MLHFVVDPTSRKTSIRLPVRAALAKTIPAINGYAMLRYNVHEEVYKLVGDWEEHGWIKEVCLSPDGDYVVLSQGLSLFDLGTMDIDWCTLQFQLVDKLEHC